MITPKQITPQNARTMAVSHNIKLLNDINVKIYEAATHGKDEVYISICTPFILIDYYKSLGFVVYEGDLGSIKWYKITWTRE